MSDFTPMYVYGIYFPPNEQTEEASFDDEHSEII